MKKMINVNLGSRVFKINEDAYTLLENYLSNLRTLYSSEEGVDEIVDDFEIRISELFGESKPSEADVITIADVENIIRQIGEPEELYSPSDEASGDKEKSHGKETTDRDSRQSKLGKRLMRDPDDKMLGGVAGGLACYLGLDPTNIRLILLILLIFPVNIPIVLIYIILWIALPLAKTAADRLVMRGEKVDLENIGKVVTEGFENAATSVNDYLHSDKPRSFLQKTADFIVSFFGLILKIGAVLLGVILVPVFLILLVVLIVVLVAETSKLLLGGIDLFMGDPLGIFTLFPFLNQYPSSFAAAITMSGILLAGIPVFALCHVFGKSLFKLKDMSVATKWVLLVLWFFSLAFLIFSTFYIFV